MAAPAGTATAPAATTAPHTPLHSAQPVPAAVHLLESVLHDVLSGGQVRSGTVMILAVVIGRVLTLALYPCESQARVSLYDARVRNRS
jgi:hypothetical protein